MKTLTGRQLWKAQCNNCCLVCKNPVIIKKYVLHHPGHSVISHFAVPDELWAVALLLL